MAVKGAFGLVFGLVNLALRADEMDNLMVDRFGCGFSEYSRQDKE